MGWEQIIFGVAYMVLLFVVWRSPKPNRDAIARLEKRVDNLQERIVPLENAKAVSAAEMREQVRVLLLPITMQQRSQDKKLNEISSCLHDISNHFQVKHTDAPDAPRTTA